MKLKKSKVFCIGLGNTGTRSLARALKALRYKTGHWQETVYMVKCSYGKLDFKFNRVKEYDAFLGLSIVRYYKQLDKKYSGSKFILTIRDIDQWLDSCERRSLEEMFIDAHGRKYIKLLPITENIELQMEVFDTLEFNREKFREAYCKNVDDVMSYFRGREKDLLVMNICGGDSWSKLCLFLGKPLIISDFPKGHIC